MPYVWVDEIECDGDCEHSKRFLDGIEDALTLLKAGDVVASRRALGVLAGDKEAKKAAEHEKELANLLSRWREEGRPGGFLEWAHHLRKASLT